MKVTACEIHDHTKSPVSDRPAIPEFDGLYNDDTLATRHVNPFCWLNTVACGGAATDIDLNSDGVERLHVERSAALVQDRERVVSDGITCMDQVVLGSSRCAVASVEDLTLPVHVTARGRPGVAMFEDDMEGFLAKSIRDVAAKIASLQLHGPMAITKTGAFHNVINT
jgi:hypothetical protein